MARGAGVSKVSDQIASWDTGSEIGTKAVLLHPFLPLVCVADDKETIRYWYYFYWMWVVISYSTWAFLNINKFSRKLT